MLAGNGSRNTNWYLEPRARKYGCIHLFWEHGVQVHVVSLEVVYSKIQKQQKNLQILHFLID
jgi:hypothetical protein